MNITFKVIPHEEQRFPFYGDGDWWEEENGDIQVRVSKQKDWRYEVIAGIHEITEAILCRQRGVKGADADTFDKRYEQLRSMREHRYGMSAFNDCGCAIDGISEPGDDIHAPYFWPHQTASIVERIMAVALCVPWQQYCDELESGR